MCCAAKDRISLYANRALKTLCDSSVQRHSPVIDLCALYFKHTESSKLLYKYSTLMS